MRRLILQTSISIDGYVAAIDRAPLQLELVEATTYPTGLAIHVHRPR